MIKQGGQWQEVDWQTALNYVVQGLKTVRDQHGAASVGALVSPHSTLEELYLAAQLVRGLGSDNIDYRLRHAQFNAAGGCTLAGHADSRLARAAVGASDRLATCARTIRCLRSVSVRPPNVAARFCAINASVQDWAMPVAASVVCGAGLGAGAGRCGCRCRPGQRA